MRTHHTFITETNSGGYVALCSCGWQGAVHPCPVSRATRGNRMVRYPDQARAAADSDSDWHARAARTARDEPVPGDE